MPASAHGVPKLHHDGAPREHVDALKAMTWPELVAYCDTARTDVPDALLILLRLPDK